MLEVLVHRRHSFLFVFIFLLFSQLVAGQTLINGQTFTNGLAIIDSPNPQNPGHAGSSINIAIDVSGDGKLPAAASLPSSGYSTGFISLEIYLVSAETNINMTVSTGPALLSGESGSTVKHLDWPIPTCMPAGDYNLTFYETSLFNREGIFTITPIPIPISNPNPAAPCTDNLNLVQVQPQSSNPLPQSPFAPGSALSASVNLLATPSSPLPAPSASRMVTVISGSPFVTLTLTLSDGDFNLPTITVTASATPTTVVLISTDIITQTNQGTVTTFTQTQTSTFTTLVAPSSSPDNLNSSPGFIPVNSSHPTISVSWCLLFGALLMYLCMF
ncbi:hypothetical protein B0H12DRAFT_1086359 [Mycena haematopus]|nr:hypothetical protein B0H12DRAFT_1086359 [Mycena haematopus]